MRYLFLTVSLLVVYTAQAAQEITWESLRPQPTHYQSVLPEHKALLAEIYVYEVAMESRQLSPLELDGYNQRVALATKFGLDVRTLLAERATGSREANEVIDKLRFDHMKLGGFLVPLEMSGTVVTQFILVPTAGACIHTPPPPANQTILVDFPAGYEMHSLYTPVWVEGDLIADSAEASVELTDGNQAIKAGYKINATSVNLYKTQ
ncbi:DUF3299 domain-containing protein [Vibrio fluvialis]|uniref:DUF3299 domain-containing protein n=1 Tax=Vibrio fluvialis TaxID=676 RepID=UPI001EECE909|nr:DUF3299 domain-containing protein [Vibrio fluvialis]EKO3428114.1 DUF3299 domain-containing protein [Vibrio fluvialis]ELX7500610.1 DUF3299 domain-containing protein [Vibrio fluvialis]MCG6413451.1 DUF3299 domain-containing protein [Vibrio fluvialis]